MSDLPLPPALVLTAGRGTRLEPLTAHRAKPSVPVAGVPLIVRVLGCLARRGVPLAVLNLHYKPDTITGRVGHGDDIGIRVRYSWETTLLGSAGGPRRARDLLGSRFFIVNGDTLADVDLTALLETHLRRSARVTMAVSDNPAPHRYGGVAVDSRDRITGFVKAGQPSAHFVGIQLVESDVFDPLPNDVPASTVGELYDAMVVDRPGSLVAHHVSDRFYDVGTPTDYLAASLDIARAEGGGDSDVSELSHVHATARLSRTVVWEHAVIDAECRLTDCIVGDSVHLPSHTRLTRTILTRSADGYTETPLDGLD